MKVISITALVATAGLSLAALAQSSVNPGSVHSAPPMSIGEHIADWFGGTATRLRALEAKHTDTELSALEKKVDELGSQITQLRADLTAEQRKEADSEQKLSSIELNSSSHMKATETHAKR